VTAETASRQLRLAGDKGATLDLIQPVISVKERHVGITTVRSSDAKLPAIYGAKANRNRTFGAAQNSLNPARDAGRIVGDDSM
jgi:hypothetical protein